MMKAQTIFVLSVVSASLATPARAQVTWWSSPIAGREQEAPPFADELIVLPSCARASSS